MTPDIHQSDGPGRTTPAEWADLSADAVRRLTVALAVADDLVLVRMDALRQDAEARHQLPAGDPDVAILEDGVYGPALDAWHAWQGAGQELRQALADLGLTAPSHPATTPPATTPPAMTVPGGAR
jgi:hypothetical protein